jgi:aspartate/methionine/tyrosine aminotransferase
MKSPNLPLFTLEEYLGEHEFKAKHLLACSDAESFGMLELLNDYADDECKALFQNLRLGYTEVKGLPQLRKQVQEFVGLAPTTIDSVTITVGAEEGIFCTFGALGKIIPGKEVLVITPCYQSLKELPNFFGMMVKEIALDVTTRSSFDTDAIIDQISSNTGAVVLNIPHSPTGWTMSIDDITRVISACERVGAYLVVDEVYRGLADKSPLPAVCSLYDKGITIGVVSKAFGLSGLRIGWLGCQDIDFQYQALSYKHYLSICASGPAEILALIALRNADALMSRNSEITLKNKELLASVIEENSDILRWSSPQGSCVGLVELVHNNSERDISAWLLENYSLLVLPGRVFDLPDSFFRVGYGRFLTEEAIGVFAAAIQQLRAGS